MKNAEFLRLCVVCIFTCSCMSIYAQNSLLSGRIYFAESRENVAYANVLLKNMEGGIITSVTSGLDGKYSTDSISPGAYVLEIYIAEHDQVELPNVILQPGKATRIDIPIRSGQKEEPTDLVQEEQTENKGLVDILGGILKVGLAAGF